MVADELTDDEAKRDEAPIAGCCPDRLHLIVRCDRREQRDDENERRDRQAKRQLYGKYGVKEYWIVDSQKATIQIYRSAKLRLAATLTKKDKLTSPLLPGFNCRVRDIFQ